MTERKTDASPAPIYDRPSEHIVSKNTQHAPWHDNVDHAAKDKSQHRRYHSLFEDLLN